MSNAITDHIRRYVEKMGRKPTAGSYATAFATGLAIEGEGFIVDGHVMDEGEEIKVTYSAHGVAIHVVTAFEAISGFAADILIDRALQGVVPAVEKAFAEAHEVTESVKALIVIWAVRCEKSAEEMMVVAKALAEVCADVGAGVIGINTATCRVSAIMVAACERAKTIAPAG